MNIHSTMTAISGSDNQAETLKDSLTPKAIVAALDEHIIGQNDAKKVDANKTPQYKPGSTCANCLQLTGKEGEEWRPCNIFPGKVVNEKGWCKVWVPKPGAK